MEPAFMTRLALGLCAVLAMLAPTDGITQNTTNEYVPDQQRAREHILGLENIGLPYLALKAAKKNPAAISHAKMRQLEADYAAELTRLAVITTRQESERFRIADRALARYEELI